MRSLVVLFALVAAATAAPHFGHAVAYSVPAVVGPAFYTGASAVSHQSRVDVHTSPAVIAEAPVAVVAEPVVEAAAVSGEAVVTGEAAVSQQSRVDEAEVVEAVSSPVIEAAEPAAVASTVYTGGSAVSHQSRVDVHHSPAVVATVPVVAAASVVAAPAVVEARSVYAPVSHAYYGGSAVSHQSRVDVESSPAFYSQHVVAPALYSAW